MSTTSPAAEAPWTNVQIEMEPEPTISYRSAMTVYEESLLRGRFVGRGWNGAGYMSFYGDVRLDPTKHASPQAFQIEIDGQLLAAHWEWAGSDQNQTERGLHAIISLKHTLRPINVRVHTLLDGTAVLTRWLEITNRGTRPAALGTASAWSGVLQLTNRWKAHMSESDAPLYSIGYMANPHWGHEGSFQWFDLPNAGYRIDGRFRRDRHRHPMFVLRNNATGEHFIGQLAWSGGYVFEFDLDADIGSTDGAARLFFRAGFTTTLPSSTARSRRAGVCWSWRRATTPVVWPGCSSCQRRMSRSIICGHAGWISPSATK
jgi:alpha-galactosidase